MLSPLSALMMLKLNYFFNIFFQIFNYYKSTPISYNLFSDALIQFKYILLRGSEKRDNIGHVKNLDYIQIIK